MSTEDSVNNIIADARNYAEDSFGSAQELIDAANQVAKGVTYVEPDLDNLGEITWPEVDELPEAPIFDASLEIPGNMPTLGQMDSLYVPDLSSIPDPPEELDTSELFNHAVPNALEAFTGSPPDLDEIDTPEAPTLRPVTSPNLRDLYEPTIPDLNIPEFIAKEPEEPPAPPENLRQEFDSIYNQMVPEMKAQVDGEAEQFIERFYPGSTQMLGKLMDRLNTYLEGGTALPEEVEQGIYDRARSRVYNELRHTEGQAWEQAARRGHTLPPGILLQQVRQAHQDAANNNAQTAHEVAKQQAELEQQNLQFAVSTAVELQAAVRNGSVQYAQTLLQVNQQAMQYAQSVIGYMVEAYNLAVQKYRTDLEHEQTRIQIFEARIRSEMAKVDKFNAEVRFAEAIGQMNQLDLQQMAQELDINRNRISLYAEEMRAVATRLEQQRLQLDRFRSEIEAYDAKARAKESEFRAYEAAMSGDRAKVDAKTAEYDGYRTHVGGLESRNRAEIQQQEAIATNNQNVVEKYKAELTPYLTEVDVNKTEFQGEVDAYRAKLDQYRADIDAQIQELNAQVQTQSENAAHQRHLAQLKTDVALKNAGLAMDRVKVQADTAINGAQLYANIAGAAVSAQNTMVQLAAETITQQ